MPFGIKKNREIKQRTLMSLKCRDISQQLRSKLHGSTILIFNHLLFFFLISLNTKIIVLGGIIRKICFKLC